MVLIIVIMVMHQIHQIIIDELSWSRGPVSETLCQRLEFIGSVISVIVEFDWKWL